MNKILFTAIILFSSTLLVTAQEQLTNNGFENWISNDFYWECENWESVNALLTEFDNNQYVSPDTAAYEGDYAMKVSSLYSSLAGQVVPGIAFVGHWVESGGSYAMLQGKPFTSKPDSLVGYYKYNSSADTARIAATLYARNSETGIRETIAQVSVIVNGVTSSYIRFSVPFDYSIDAAPDSIGLTIFSSAPSGAIDGTEISVDAFTLKYNMTEPTLPLPTNIFNSDLAKKYSVYPNPTSDYIVINNDTDSKLSLYIYDIYGKLVLEDVNIKNKKQIEVSSLQNGNYIYSIHNGNKVIYTNKLMIAK